MSTQNEQKTSVIVKCLFTGDWSPPKGNKIYYHEITFENGDVGNIGKYNKYPDEIKEGTRITYSIDPANKNKITIYDGRGDKKQWTGNFKKSGGYGHKSTDFLGFAFSYSKDIIVARITKGPKPEDPVKELIQGAKEIFAEMKKILDKENGVEEKKQEDKNEKKE